LAVALAESCFAAIRDHGKALGACISLDSPVPAEFALFSESGARALASVPASQLADVQATARQYGLAAREIGRVIRDGALRIEYKGRVVIESPLEPLREAWANSLERTLTSK
jgi:phosphoribosylformylglycinamidine (FGAM) synthase-like enzyme